MGIEFKEKRIGPNTYRVTQLGTKTGRAMLVRLVRMLGPGAGSFAMGVGRGGDALDSALLNGAGEALHELAARLREDDVAAITDEFAKYTVVVESDEVQPRLSDVFDDHFAGRYDLMLQWVRFCMEVNFGSFFADASGKGWLGKLLKMLSALQSQPTSTGTSTASQPANATPTA